MNETSSIEKNASHGLMSSNSINKNIDKNRIKSYWQASLSSLQTELDSEVFNAFLAPLSYKEFDSKSNALLISAPTGLIKSHVQKRYSKRLVSALNEIPETANAKIIFSLESEGSSPSDLDDTTPRHTNNASIDYKADYKIIPPKLKTPTPKIIPIAKAAAKRRNLNPDCNFQNLVVGEHNEFAVSVAQELSTGKKFVSNFNPLYVYGNVGLGKTHILHAIGNAYVEANPDANVYYTSSENFTNKLIASLRSGNIDKFKKQIRSVDLLLVDDIQFLAKKQHTQEEFFHTFNSLKEAGKLIVIACDRLPSELKDFDERLMSRFSSGVIAELDTPSYECRAKIIEKLAARHDIELDNNICELIASSAVCNVRELEGCFNRILAFSSLKKEAINFNAAKSIIEKSTSSRKITLSPNDIRASVANFYKLKVQDLESKRRQKSISKARQIAIYLIRKHTSIAYSEIGNKFGNRDHSSIIYSANKIETALQEDEDLKEEIRTIEQEMGL